MLHRKSEKGQALILIVFAVVVLIGLTAVAVDGGRAYAERRQAQNAADNAALAAGLAKVRGQNFTTAAQNLAASNGYDGGASNDVVITTAATPSGVCPGTGTDITITINSHVPMTFATVVGWTEVVNTVQATARACDVHTTGGVPLYAGASVMATKTAACGGGLKDKALFMQGSSQLQLWGGDMASASQDGGCLYFKGGETQFKKQESGTACADILTAATSGGTFNSVKPQDGCGNKYYGQSFEAPPDDYGITCTGNATKSGSTLSPGNWTGSFPPAGVTTLQPGTYCVNGTFTLNGGDNLTGNGVTIVMNSGNLKWNGNSEVKLSAPKSGPTKGLLIYLPPGNTSDVDVNGNSNAKITGTILAQNSNCFFAGSGQLQKQVLQFICYTWGMDGNGQAEIEYKSDEFFAPLKVENPIISLLK